MSNDEFSARKIFLHLFLHFDWRQNFKLSTLVTNSWCSPLHMAAAANEQLLSICFGRRLAGFGNNLKQRPTSPSIVSHYCQQHTHFMYWQK